MVMLTDDSPESCPHKGGSFDELVKEKIRNAIGHQRTSVRQGQHIAELKDRPLPPAGLPANDSDG